MNKLLAGLAVVLMFSGCATMPGFGNGNAPGDTVVLMEAGAIALSFYELNDGDFPNAKYKAKAAMDAADMWLLMSYGLSPLRQNPKYTMAGLIHSEVLSDVADLRILRIAYAARIVFDANGEFTGESWLDALLTADALILKPPVTE